MSKTILITGTSAGFGKLTVKTLSQEGYQVIATMRDSSGRNKEAAQELAELPGVEVVELDVTSDTSVQEAISYINVKHPFIDVLVNNAGVAGGGVFEGYSLEKIKQMYEVNVFGVLRMYQAVLPSMRKANRGLIINLSSLVGLFSLPYFVPYSSTKFALEAFNEGLQVELKPFGIENVSIVAGAHPTEMNNGSKSGIGADKEEIIAAYGQVAKDSLQATADFIGGNMHQNDPQHLVNVILDLIRMEDGTRPLRVAVDAIAEGADKEFIEGVKPLKSNWAAKYNVTLLNPLQLL